MSSYAIGYLIIGGMLFAAILKEMINILWPQLDAVGKTRAATVALILGLAWPGTMATVIVCAISKSAEAAVKNWLRHGKFPSILG